MNYVEYETIKDIVSTLKKIDKKSEDYAKNYDFPRACGTAQGGLSIAIAELDVLLKESIYER